MPRYAITTATKHGEESPSVIAGPEHSIDKQKAALRDLAASNTHPEYSEVQLWESDRGINRRIRFRPAAPISRDPDPGKKAEKKK